MDTIKTNIDELSGPELRCILDGDEAPDLYVPYADGNVRFWIVPRPRVFLIGSTQFQYDQHGVEGVQAFKTYHQMTTLGNNLDGSGANDSCTIVEIAQRYMDGDFRRFVLHSDAIKRSAYMSDKIAFAYTELVFAINGITKSTAIQLASTPGARSFIMSKPWRFDRDAPKFVIPPRTARHANLFQTWMDTLSIMLDGYFKQLEFMDRHQAETSLDGEAITTEAMCEEAAHLLPDCLDQPVMFKISARCLMQDQWMHRTSMPSEEFGAIVSRMHQAARETLPTLYDNMPSTPRQTMI